MSLIGLLADKATVTARSVYVTRGRVSEGQWWRPAVSLLLVLLLGFTGIAHAQSKSDNTEEPLYDIDIPQLDAAEALNRLAEQTGAVMLFPYDLAQSRTANAVRGTYTLAAALRALLKDTGLTGGLSKRRVIQISAEETEARKDEGESMNSRKKATLAAVVAGAFVGGVNAQEVTAQMEIATETSVVTGQVKASQSWANLKGAQVEIVETGQKTTTDDLGRFRFASVAPGEYTLRISYLGRDPLIAKITIGRHDFNQTFAMSSEDTVDTIVVYGSRSARAQALNQERTAENSSTIVSSDLLGNFSGTTLSDALRRVPGVAFERDAGTGDGTNVIVRGLAPDFNQVTLNGLTLPTSNGTGRSADLSNILADSVEEITISKTLLPSQDSAGTGGLVEIVTKSPLDRPPRYADFLVEVVKRNEDFGEDLLASGTVSGRFGEAQTFGTSLSIQYREQDVTTLNYVPSLTVGPYLPLQIDGSLSAFSLGFFDPRSPFPLEEGIELFPTTVLSSSQNINAETLTLTGALEWDVSESTNFQLTYLRSANERTTNTRRTTVSTNARYRIVPVPGLNGELRRVLTTSAENGRFGVNRGYFYTPDELNVTDTISFKGTTTTGKWTFSHLFGYAKGEREAPSQLTATFSLADFFGINDYTGLLLPEARNPTTGEITSYYAAVSGSGYPLPLLNDEGWEAVNATENVVFQRGTRQSSFGENERFSVDFDTEYDFDNDYLKYIQLGVNYENSEFVSNAGETAASYRGVVDFDTAPVFLPPVSELGLSFDETDLGLVTSSDRGFSVFSFDSSARFFEGLDELVATSDRYEETTAALDPLALETGTEEDDLAIYIQGRVDIGRFEFIGGVRYNQTKVDAVFIDTPTVIDDLDGDGTFEFDNDFAVNFRRIVSDSATQRDYLPRFLVNYRHNDNLVARVGYFTSVARPQIRQLSANQSLSLSLDPTGSGTGNKPALFINKGNPDLEPSFTHSFDFSIEYYDQRIGVAKVSLFYKKIDNLLELNEGRGVDELVDVVLPDDPRFQDVAANPDNYNISAFQPFNNPSSASIWGVEATLEKQLDFLPGAWSGLGVYSNYTFSESGKDEVVTWFSSPVLDSETGAVISFEAVEIPLKDVPFAGQPEHSGTAGLTYNKYSIDASLLYSYQSKRQIGTSGQNFNLNPFFDAFDSLDFRFVYNLDDLLGSNIRLFFEGNDLLKGKNDPNNQQYIGGENGTPRYYTFESFLGGRSFTLGVRTNF